MLYMINIEAWKRNAHIELKNNFREEYDRFNRQRITKMPQEQAIKEQKDYFCEIYNDLHDAIDKATLENINHINNLIKDDKRTMRGLLKQIYSK